MSKHSIPQTGMVESILLQLPMRLFLGTVFVFAAYNKIPAVQSFAEAIKGFQVVDADTHPELIIIGAFVIPWFELFAGLMLILGLRARAAVLGIGLVLAMFIYALLHVIFTDVSADCSCFGDSNFICGSSVGWCQVIRNVVFLIPAGYLLVRGPGRVSIDQIVSKPDQNPDSHAYRPESLSNPVDADASRA
jgi:uncharacterized membrane protein YphA (DoxX/SURF4 family)